MRIAFLGYNGPLPPIALELTGDVPFVPGEYIDLGYTNYDVMCIGAAGGRGGGIAGTGIEQRLVGGGGGGGGSNRVFGVLSELPSSCAVVVGSGGADSPNGNGVEDIGLLLPGVDGGFSSFNDTTCRASGGKGGDAVPTHDVGLMGGPGGRGGIGGSIVAGGGGAPETDGFWNGTIGEGGGGGQGGYGTYYLGAPNVVTESGATSGRGSYSPDETSFTGPAESPKNEGSGDGLFANIVPGNGGGARATLLTGLTYVYGSKYDTNLSGDGGVIVRLTRV